LKYDFFEFNMQSNRNYNSNTGSSNEAIVEKLHGALAKLRARRDTAHREMSLSRERLRLVKEEKDALGKTVDATREKLVKLKAQASGEAEKELAELKRQVEQLAKDVRKK
jgi:predicted  nucleic acid-binding Zn-ribbon protein